jgi:hypothetical protein
MSLTSCTTTDNEAIILFPLVGEFGGNDGRGAGRGQQACRGSNELPVPAWK